MPSKTMWFSGIKITASRSGGLGLLLGLLLVIVVGSVVVRAAVRAAEAVAPTVTLILTLVPALALTVGGIAVAVVLTRHVRGERDARFVQRKLAAELRAELPAPTVRVESLRPELPPVRVACEQLSESEQMARGLAALEAATRRPERAPVDLDNLEHRR